MNTASAVEKYKGLIQEINPMNRRSLQQCREIAIELSKRGFEVKGIVGNGRVVGASEAEFIPENDLIRDGFPEDIPASFLIQGSSAYHSAAECDRQLRYSWGYWTFIGQWILRMYW